MLGGHESTVHSQNHQDPYKIKWALVELWERREEEEREGEKREWGGAGEGEERSGVCVCAESKLCVDWLLKKERQDTIERSVEPKPETETESLNMWLFFQKS